MAKQKEGEPDAREEILKEDIPPQAPESTTPPEPTEESADEWKKKFEELQSHASRLADRIGKLEKRNEELSAYEAWYRNQFQAPQQQQPWAQQPPQKPSEEDEYEYLDRKSFREEMERQKLEQRYKMAYQMAPFARAAAQSQNPEVFEGVDLERLDQVMYGGVQGGLTAPEVLSSPDSWKRAAWLLKGEGTQFKLTSSPPNPSVPDNQEAPTPRQTSGETGGRVRITDEERFIASKFRNPKTGKPYTDKEIAEIKRKEQERRRKLGM